MNPNKIKYIMGYYYYLDIFPSVEDIEYIIYSMKSERMEIVNFINYVVNMCKERGISVEKNKIINVLKECIANGNIKIEKNKEKIYICK